MELVLKWWNCTMHRFTSLHPISDLVGAAALFFLRRDAYGDALHDECQQTVVPSTAALLGTSQY